MDDSRLPKGDVPRSDAYVEPFGEIVRSLRDSAIVGAISHNVRDQIDKMAPLLRNNLDWAAQQRLDCRAQAGRAIQVTTVERQAREFAQALSDVTALLDWALAEAKACPNFEPLMIKNLEYTVAYAREAIRELEEGQENLERSSGWTLI